MHKHIDDVQHHLNFTNTDINIFSETRSMRSDNDSMYDIDGYTLFRNDGHSLVSRPFGGLAVFSFQFLLILPHVTIIGIYRSPRIPVQQLCEALTEVFSSSSSQFNISIGDFNIIWLHEANRRILYNFFYQ